MSQPLPAAAPETPLPSPAHQMRNLLLFGAIFALNYLSAPISYIGVTHAPLCKRIGATAAQANQPASAYFLCTAATLFLAWWLPYASWLKRNMVVCYALQGVAGVGMAAVLLSDLSDELKFRAVVLHAVILGIANPSATAFLWEAIGRGLSEEARGRALGLAFGAGPLLAVAGSYASQIILNQVAYPWNFIALFGATGPIFLGAAALSGLFVVPRPLKENIRWFRMAAGGLAVLALPFGLYWAAEAISYVSAQTGLPGEVVYLGLVTVSCVIYIGAVFFRTPVLLMAALVIVLLYIGNTAVSNMNLYTQQVLNAPPESYSGYQNMLRFGFKMAAGFFLGWLLTRTNPRAGILVTAGLFLIGQLWAIFVSGPWYLLAFGFFGAGELIGVYGPNYLLSASRPADYRRNLAIAQLLMMPTAPFGPIFGLIADEVGKQTTLATGFRASFAVAAACILAGMILALATLPARPRPAEPAAPSAGS